MCRCSKNHLQLRGNSPFGRPWTQIAEPYPRALCDLIAKASCCATGWKGYARLDVTGCSKTGSLRPGEATTPGPRRPNRPRNMNLEDVQLLSAATLMRESHALTRFLGWVGRLVSSMPPEELLPRAPEFLAAALCVFGKVEFERGGALSSFRHQRWVPSVRASTSPCWEGAC